MTAATALITGASAGLGVEFARQLAAQGYDLVLVARREARLAALAEELQSAFGITVTTLPADLSEPEAGAALEAALAARGIEIDFLVNNAGSAGPDLIRDRDWDAQMAFYRLMMTSAAELCHRFIPGMLARGRGRVINVASVAGRIPSRGSCNYGPTKAYLIALSEELNMTYRHRGLQVCALCPGFTHTDFLSAAGLDDMKAGVPKWLWYDADVVVQEGIEAVEKGRSVQVSGRLYRVLDPFTQSVWTRRFFKLRFRRD